MRGGNEVTVETVKIGHKALLLWNEYRPGASIGDLRRLIAGEKVKLMADGSPFFLRIIDDLRFVLVVREGFTLNDRRFTLVDVTKVKIKPYPERR